MARKAKKYSILYVDDEQENLVSFKFVFRKHYRIHLAQSADEGLELLEKSAIHLVITDQRMPRVTGIEFLEKVAKKYPDITRIILTGYSDVEAVIQAINKGRVYRYITKPWERNELKITIDNALEAFELKRQNKALIENLQSSNKQLEKTNTELDYFIYRSSHDLRRPLTTLMGLNKVAQVSISDNMALQLFENVHTTAYIMDKMLLKLLMIREVNKYSETNLVETNFFTIYEKVQQNLTDVLSTTQVKPEINIPEHSNFYTSTVLLEAVTEYLLENAIYYGTLGGEQPTQVKLNVEITDNQITIIVWDNGMGIEEEIHTKIFEMYFRGSSASKGNGLGLYVGQKITKKLGGTLELKTELNQFTEFKLQIPISQTTQNE